VIHDFALAQPNRKKREKQKPADLPPPHEKHEEICPGAGQLIHVDRMTYPKFPPFTQRKVKLDNPY